MGGIPMSVRITRRWFMKQAFRSAGLGICITGSSAWARGISPNDKIGIGIVGVGGMGTQHLRVLLRNPGAHIHAVCDVDQARRDEGKARVDDAYRNADCFSCNDFRDLLEQPGIDAILIGTPDHWHIPISIAACKAGKDVYSEKPLTHTINEGKALIRVVQRYGRVFQTGTQQRSSREFRFACGLARQGKLGKVHTAELHLPTGGSTGWVPDTDPPPGLDWDLWLGPAPWAPFNQARHPGGFRSFWDYSGGALTDWGAHHADTAQWGLGTDDTGPIYAEGIGVLPADGIAETFDTFNVTLTYANGAKIVTKHPEHGVRFIGSAGWVHVWRGGIEAEPADLLRETVEIDNEQITMDPTKQQDWRVWASPAHHQNWLQCIRTRKRPVCHEEIGHRSITVCHLANLCMRLGRKLQWDPVKEEFVGDDEANRYLFRPYRPPWRL